MIKTKFGKKLEMMRAITDRIQCEVAYGGVIVSRPSGMPYLLYPDHDRFGPMQSHPPIVISFGPMPSLVSGDTRLYVSSTRASIKDLKRGIASNSTSPLDRLNVYRMLAHIWNHRAWDVSLSQPDGFDVIVRIAKALCRGDDDATSNIASIEEGAG